VPPTRSQEFLASTGDLTGLLSLEEGTNAALKRVTDLAAGLIEVADGVGITLLPAGGPVMRTAAHSSPWVELVDEDQYTTGEGPCIDAIHRATVISLKDLDDPRYPRFCTRAREEGLGSVLALPLTVNDRTVGALNLYSREPDAFDADAQDLARNFAGRSTSA
jgi:transcriptional regulator with GAF, ATPase, and Fis domain